LEKAIYKIILFGIADVILIWYNERVIKYESSAKKSKKKKNLMLGSSFLSSLWYFGRKLKRQMILD